MKRGDIVTVATAGDYGKPRPAVVVQSSALIEADSVLVALITSHARDLPLFRLTVEATTLNGLANKSHIMGEKLVAVPRAKIGQGIGRLADADLIALNQILAFVIGLADPPFNATPTP